MIVPKPNERGAALLAVLLLVAIMGALAATAFDKLRMSMALAGNGAAIEQGRAFAGGLESLAALRADDLIAQSPGTLTLAGNWNGSARPVPLPDAGFAQVVLGDGGNCFNLNSLARGDDPSALVARPAGITQFIGLMAALGIPANAAIRIADSAADWIDADDVPLPRGAEDAAYAGRTPAHRAANTFFAEPSELRAIEGVTAEYYGLMRQHLCALPSSELAPINANTLLPDQAPLAAMLVPGAIPLDAARAAILRRSEAGWGDLGNFWEALGGVNPASDILGQVKLGTRWFTLRIEVDMGGAEFVETALIDARYAPSRVVARRWAPDE